MVNLTISPDKPKVRGLEFLAQKFLLEEVKICRYPDHGFHQKR